MLAGSSARSLRKVSIASSPDPFCISADVARARIECERRFQRIDRAVRIARGLQHDAELQVGGRELRVRADRLAEVLQRRCDIALLLQRQAEVIAGFGVIGTQPNSLLKRRQRAIEILGPPARGAEMILGIEGLRIQLNRAFERRNRFSGPPHASQQEAEPIVDDRVSGIEISCLRIERGRAGKIVLPFRLRAGGEQLARIRTRLRIGGDRHHRPEQRQSHDDRAGGDAHPAILLARFGGLGTL